jgi:hypothetical protein
VAAVSGAVGYICFASLDSPETSGPGGTPLVFVIVSLLGISQIGSIVCSLGLLGRGVSDSESKCTSGEVEQSSPEANDTLADGSGHLPSEDNEANISQEDESRGLLGENSLGPKSLIDLKGSIAGIYSLSGGAGILLLTKLGGYLFDVKSPASPFYMLSIFNIILLVGILLCSIVQARRVPRTPGS